MTPIALPPSLAEYLRNLEGTRALLQPTDTDTVMVVKTDIDTIIGVKGVVKMLVAIELYWTPTSPVVRTTVSIFDLPTQPLILECFTNVNDTDQLTDFSRLRQQDTLPMLFYDDQVQHRLSKQVPLAEPIRDSVQNVIALAQAMLAKIPNDELDFDKAKLSVLHTISLDAHITHLAH